MVLGFVMLALATLGSSVHAYPYAIVDTNQSTCYDSDSGAALPCLGTGYDADHQGNQQDYTVSADGTMVVDNVTGLTWTSKVDISGDGTVDYGDKLTQPDADTYCADLTIGGYDWRLPSIKDLYSLMDFTGGDPSGYSGNDTSGLEPFYNDAFFERAFGDTGAGERIIDSQFATATLYVSPLGTIGGNGAMFGVNFVDGRIKGYPYAFPANDPKRFYVLCVTGNPDYGGNDFVDNLDGTVSDLATGLMWEQDDHTSSDFEDAVATCGAAATGGYGDWRLPNVKELQSILDYSRAPDLTESAAIDPVFAATALTNEEGATDWGYYWSSTTHATYNGNGSSAAYVAFGRALGYFQGTVQDVHGAGAQRSDDKAEIPAQAQSANAGYGTFSYWGPQGDILRLDNMVRCVRDIDATAPVLAEVAPVTSPTTDTTPDYTFNSTEEGTIGYGGSCNGTATTAAAGDNTLTLSGPYGTALPAGSYDDCTLTVTDAAGNRSEELAITAFVVEPVAEEEMVELLRGGSAAGTYATIGDAYAAARSGDTILMRSADFAEDLHFDAAKELTLSGGWDAEFTQSVGSSRVTSLTVAAGSIVIEGRLSLKGNVPSP